MTTNVDHGYEAPPVHELRLLMLVRQEDEQLLPHKLYTEEIVNFYCFKVMNQHLKGVQGLNEYKSQPDFKPKEMITVVIRKDYGIGRG